MREQERLQASKERKEHWKRWGPYTSERAWGTVREDYSADGNAWEYLPHDSARSKAYRWGEDGIAGISDRKQFLCFAVALWNGRDSILKERLFGLTGNQGNHGEDVKEYYFYLDSTPTHSYMKFLYKYPQTEYPYRRLVQENARRGKLDPEFELIDTGAFSEDRYFDVTVEYAKSSPEEMLVKIHVTNQGPERETLHLLPTVWFRNTWSWGLDTQKPEMHIEGEGIIAMHHNYLGGRRLYCEGKPPLLFTENETNKQRLYGATNQSRFVKDGINNLVVDGDAGAVNPEGQGTKAAAHYILNISPGECVTIRLRFSNESVPQPFGGDFEDTFRNRIREADEYYAEIIPKTLTVDAQNVMRQAFAGMLWNKQFYGYDVSRWLIGDPSQPSPPAERLRGRNHEWTHLYNEDIISMPDKWEYPWYAAWDLAFHCIPLALVDPEFAKEQLVLFTREWYMHPNGQIPAYEWAFNDVNPPVHAWAALARLQNRCKKNRDCGPRISQTRLSQTDVELHMVGQSQRCGRQQYLPGRIPGIGQHRRLRSKCTISFR